MGIWSPALYGGDLAEDLKVAIKAVARLPYDPAKIVEVLCQCHRDESSDPNGEEHTTFWLVLADQFHKRGLDAPSLFQRALEIIDSGQDLEIYSTLGLSASDLKKRKKVLDGLRTKLTLPLPNRKDKSLSEPEPYLMNVGDLLVFPVCDQGCCVNPYTSKAMQDKSDWKQAAWGAIVIIDCGRAFDFLAWYRPLELTERIPVEQSFDHSGPVNFPLPDMRLITSKANWNVEQAGTCSPSHFRKIQFHKIGQVPLAEDRVRKACESLPPGDLLAINDICISNSLFPTWEKSRNSSLQNLQVC